MARVGVYGGMDTSIEAVEKDMIGTDVNRSSSWHSVGAVIYGDVVDGGIYARSWSGATR